MGDRARWTNHVTERDAQWALLWLEARTDMSLAGRKRLQGLSALGVLEAIAESGDRRLAPAQHVLRTERAPERVPANVVLRDDAAYPDVLRHHAFPPWGLYVDGDVSLLRNRLTLGVVGSRRPRPDSRQFARAAAATAGRAGAVIVSGLAMGIDGIAHQAALGAGAPTIAVLGSGIDRVHPSSHRSLARKIVDCGGLLVSEYAGDKPGRKWRFPARNRIIAALSRYLLVVQAAATSGSLLTADQALALGVGVGVVPGGIADPSFEGATRLLRDGADVVVDEQWPCSQLGLRPPSPEMLHDWGEYLESPRRPEEIAQHFRLLAPDVLRRLLQLQLDRLVQRQADGRYVNCDPTMKAH